ncbi:MAG: hypothetical protein ABI595_08560 [Actinomycetota bacterium]
MSAKQEQPSKSRVGDSYDLAVSLRQRLADGVGPRPTSVASQLQSAARERLGSDRAIGERVRSRLGLRRHLDHA